VQTQHNIEWNATQFLAGEFSTLYFSIATFRHTAGPQGSLCEERKSSGSLEFIYSAVISRHSYDRHSLVEHKQTYSEAADFVDACNDELLLL
jgi:hypothetical protein